MYIPLALLVLAGSIPGAFLLKNVNAQYIKVVFGIVVIMIGTEMFFRENSKIKFKKSKIILGIIRYSIRGTLWTLWNRSFTGCVYGKSYPIK